jgi:outer membrane biosynthesis protein TonB
MRRSAAWSLLLHVTVILAVIIGLPHFFHPAPDEAPIPMEIVTVADKTTQKDRPPQPPQPVKPREKPPEPQQAQPKPQPPMPAPPPPPAPSQQAEAKPTPQPQPAPEPKAEHIPDKPVKKEPPKAPEQVSQPQRKFADAKPQKKPQPTKDDFLNSVLKDVAPPKAAQNDAPKQPVKNPSTPPAQQKAASISDQLTMSEIDFIRRQYIDCWNPPAGARDAQNLVVLINVDYNPDGSVRRAEIADTARMSDTFYRTAAESALRAVLNPRCNPLKAPPAKYDLWKSVTLSFNPKDLFGT